MKEKQRLARLIDREFEEWLKVSNAEVLDEERKRELEVNIRAYANQYKELTGEYYHYVK